MKYSEPNIVRRARETTKTYSHPVHQLIPVKEQLKYNPPFVLIHTALECLCPHRLDIQVKISAANKQIERIETLRVTDSEDKQVILGYVAGGPLTSTCIACSSCKKAILIALGK